MRSSRHCRCKDRPAARRASGRLRRRSRASARRIAPLAATPPAATSACGRPRRSASKRKAARQRSTITSTAAAWNEAQRSATSVIGQRRDALGFQPHRRLQAGKGKVGVLPSDHRAGEVESRRDRHSRPPVRRAGRRDRAGRAVWRPCRRLRRRRRPPSSRAAIVADAVHRDELAVAARDQQQQIGKVDAVGQPRRQAHGLRDG